MSSRNGVSQGEGCGLEASGGQAIEAPWGPWGAASFVKFIFLFCWGVVAFQFCVSFRGTGNWFSCTHTHLSGSSPRQVTAEPWAERPVLPGGPDAQLRAEVGRRGSQESGIHIDRLLDVKQVSHKGMASFFCWDRNLLERSEHWLEYVKICEVYRSL